MKERQTTETNMLVLDAYYEGFTPEEMFDHWTKPELLSKWNAEVSEVDARPGGKYVKKFGELGWEVTGEFTIVNRPTHLAFTWNWDHTPGAKETLVDVTFTARESGGTQLILRQGPFGDTAEDATTRQAITEGWLHFGMKLAGLRPGDVDLEPSVG